MHWAKEAVCTVAALGLAASGFVAFLAWEGAPPVGAVTLELAGFGLITAGVLGMAFVAPRPLAIPAAVVLLVFGWFGTWAYGFLWVPGLAALAACFFPRPEHPFRRRGVPEPGA